MMTMMPNQGVSEQNAINAQLLQVVQQQNMMLQHMYTQMASTIPGMAIPGMPPTPGSPRPLSVHGGGYGQPPRPGLQSRTMSMVNPPNLAQQPRTMSMLNTTSPFANQWGTQAAPLISGAGSVRGFGSTYAPSVAPSERSLVGQPSRYRPVSTVNLGDSQSTITSLTAPLESDVSMKKKSGFFSAIIHSKGKVGETTNEDEDDWASFARKRRSAMPKSAAA
jgi:hypothetical protein